MGAIQGAIPHTAFRYLQVSSPHNKTKPCLLILAIHRLLIAFTKLEITKYIYVTKSGRAASCGMCRNVRKCRTDNQTRTWSLGIHGSQTDGTNIHGSQINGTHIQARTDLAG